MGSGGFWWALVGFIGFGGFYRVLSGFIGLYLVLSGFIGFCATIFFVSSTVHAGGWGGCRNRRTKTHADETHNTRAVGSHNVVIDGSLVACLPVRQPQSTVPVRQYFQLNHCWCDDQLACARPTASGASAVVVRGGGLIGGREQRRERKCVSQPKSSPFTSLQ